MIALTCPKCRVSLQLKVELGGKKIKCPKCQAVLQVPTPAAAAAAAARPKSLAPAPPVDDLSPYGIEPIQEVPEEAKDNRIDDLVIVANRQKARNRAWNIVGPPAKWIKVVALIACFLWVVMFLYMTMATILYLHKYEQFIRKVDGGPKSMNEIRWMWPVNEFVERDAAPGYVFGITCAVFFPVMTIYGFILAGAESM
ncbi:MAG TPA: hypothetical protein PKD86_15355, partial [Gemmatales bacterium]|nr:hypothetical protein [Gemmatales bacterium]